MPMWVFGYGSLVWKIDFPYAQRIPGYIKGYVRRFWQGSIDHRGTVTSPGRVVTLIPYEEYLSTHSSSDPHHHPVSDAICWGVAYRIPDEDVERVRAHLDHREKNGYSCLEADVFHPDYMDGKEPVVKNALVYIATSENESFLGPKSAKEMAEQIASARGPSGWNADYLLGLSRSMKILAPQAHDPHLEDLEREVLKALGEAETKVHVDSLSDSANASSSCTLKSDTSTITIPSSSHLTIETISSTACSTVQSGAATTSHSRPGVIRDEDLEELRELLNVDVVAIARELALAGDVGTRIEEVATIGDQVVVAAAESRLLPGEDGQISIKRL